MLFSLSIIVHRMLPHFNLVQPNSLIIKSGLSHCCFVYFFLMASIDLSNIIKTLLSQFTVHTTSKKIIDLLKDNDFWIVGTDVKFPNCVPKVDIIVCLLKVSKFRKQIIVPKLLPKNKPSSLSWKITTSRLIQKRVYLLAKRT